MTLPNKFWSSAYAGQHVAHQPGAPILQVAALDVAYDGHLAVEQLSFILQTGERVAVIGPNGAGKSTLLKAIAGVLTPVRGEISVYGAGPGGHICIAYVPQRSLVDWDFPVTVADVVMMGRTGKLGLLRRPRKCDWDYVQECLELVGMGVLARRQIGELSGGQQQRMFIARALAQEAELMLMDEPLTGLDVPAQESIFQVLETLRARQVTVMLSTHDLNQAAEQFDRVMLLNRRLLGFGPPETVFTRENLLAAYGGQLRLIPVNGTELALSDTCCEGHKH